MPIIEHLTEHWNEFLFCNTEPKAGIYAEPRTQPDNGFSISPITNRRPIAGFRSCSRKEIGEEISL
jgi:hypothetical protein